LRCDKFGEINMAEILNDRIIFWSGGLLNKIKNENFGLNVVAAQ
jgi:hypothetical protein